MSDEERARIREERRQQWQSLSPEEQAQIRERRREQWEAMSPEEQAQIRERRRGIAARTRGRERESYS